MTPHRCLVALTLLTVLDGCAAAPPGVPAPAASRQPADTGYLAKTRYAGCQKEDGLVSQAGRSAVVRYYATSDDSVRHSFRVVAGPSTALCLPAAIAVGPTGELFVLNRAPDNEWRDSSGGRWQTWVTVYDSAAGGDVPPLRVLDVQPSWLGSVSTMVVDRNGNLYLGSRAGDIIDEGSIAVFEPGADGDARPVRVIAGPTTGLRRPAALAIDGRGYVYTMNVKGDLPTEWREMERRLVRAGQRPDVRAQPTVRVFAPGAGGDVEPFRLIAGDRTGLSQPMGLAVDRRDRLFVANQGPTPDRYSVTVYDPSATGDAEPVRRFIDIRDYYGMVRPRRVAIGSHDSLYVRSEISLTVFALADTTGPSRSFFRNAPSLFALDRHDSLYTLAGDSVKVFPPSYAGAGAPVRTLGGPETGIRSVTAMALDGRGYLYLAVGDSSLIRVYAPGASGNQEPVRTIAGYRTGLMEPLGIAVDRDDRLYVTNGQRRSTAGGKGAIRVYAAEAQGEDEPVDTFTAPEIRLPAPSGLAFDGNGDLYLAAGDEKTGGQIVVLEVGGRLVTRRMLIGPSTLLRNPIALAFGRGDTLYALNAFGDVNQGWIPGLMSVNATVTVYPPGASGETAPVRAIDVVRNLRVPGFRATVSGFRDLMVDSAGAVQVWSMSAGLVFRPGSSETGTRVTLEPGAVGNAAAVTVGEDGTVYLGIHPTSMEMVGVR